MWNVKCAASPTWAWKSGGLSSDVIHGHIMVHLACLKLHITMTVTQYSLCEKVKTHVRCSNRTWAVMHLKLDCCHLWEIVEMWGHLRSLFLPGDWHQIPVGSVCNACWTWCKTSPNQTAGSDPEVSEFGGILLKLEMVGFKSMSGYSVLNHSLPN